MRGDRDTGVISFLAVVAMAVAAYVMLAGSGATAMAFNGAFVVDGFARFAKVLILLGSALTLIMAQGYMENAKLDALRISGAGAARDRRHDADGVGRPASSSLYMGLELQSLALYVLAAFNRDSREVERGGAEIFRPGRAVVGHAALRHLADLRLHRLDRVRGRGAVSTGRAASPSG